MGPVSGTFRARHPRALDGKSRCCLSVGATLLNSTPSTCGRVYVWTCGRVHVSTCGRVYVSTCGRVDVSTAENGPAPGVTSAARSWRARRAWRFGGRAEGRPLGLKVAAPGAEP